MIVWQSHYTVTCELETCSRLFCLQTRCAYAGAPLAEGTVEDNILTCTWHGSKFRIFDGEMLKGPAKKGLHV